jgi:PAS domain S-box-containing protein
MAGPEIIRKLMTKELTQERILAACTAGVIATDSDGRVTFINPVARGLLKQDDRKIAGWVVSDISQILGETVSEVLKTGREIIGQRFSYKTNSLEVDIVPAGEKAHGAGVVCSLKEVGKTESMRRQLDELAFVKLQFETLVEVATYGIWILDGDGIVLKVNPAAERLIGVKAENVVGRNIVRLVETGVIDDALTPYVLAAKRPVSRLLHVIKTKKHVMSTGTPVLDENGDILLLVVNEYDMTTLNSLQVQLEQMRDVAEKYKDELSALELSQLKDHEIIAKSPEMRQVLRVSLKLARLDVSNILISGESGTGKGLVSKFIHESSRRNKGPFIQVNCAAIPESLLEAELFGFEKGAFTGAGEKGKVGLFELAQHGTLFLDEIGELSTSVQAKLLKCLDDHEIMRVGGLKPIKVDCIILAATNQNLEALVQAKTFREDLYHRLNVFSIRIPPLRERPEDVFEMTNHYLKKYNKAFGLNRRLSTRAANRLRSHDFSGNVRELKNILKSTMVVSETDVLDDFIGSAVPPGPDSVAGEAALVKGDQSLNGRLGESERKIFEEAMVHCRSTRELAHYLGTNQSLVVRRMKKYGLVTK